MDDNQKSQWLDFRRKSFEAGLDEAWARAQRVPVLNVIPGEYFSRGSTECRELFINGHFVGCISLCQAVAEGLSKFLIKVKRMRSTKDYKTRCHRLFKEKIISKQSLASFQNIHADDRDDFHHMNETIAVDYQTLERRAEECLTELYKIEAEIFDHRFEQGTLIPKFPEYWSINSESGTASVSLRQYF